LSWLGPYVWDVFANWFSLALLILGLNDLSKWMGGRSWEWLSDHKWKLVVVYLLLAQGMAYGKLASRPAPTPAPPSPVVAENPDHARLVERLEQAERRERALQDERNQLRQERDQAREAKTTAERRADDLQRQLGAAKGRAADCDRLATLSSQGLTLIANLRAKRADLDSRRALDEWYSNVCSAMSPAQCAAFRAAPPAPGGWVAYPVEDGGYSQTSRGRSAYLSAQLANLCR
jgi:hypothetical protein